MTLVLRIDSLPQSALDAMAAFCAGPMEDAKRHLGAGQHVTIVLPPAAFDHADWRRAMARDLAREYAPLRINIVAGRDQAAIMQTLAYLENAPGVTGQYLPLAGAGRFDG